MNTKKIFIFVLAIFVIMAGVFFALRTFYPVSISQNLAPQDSGGQKLSLQIDVNDRAWDNWEGQTTKLERDRFLADSTSAEAVKFADSYLSGKLGATFFKNFVSYFPVRSGLMKNGFYSLYYLLKIPEKGIDYKTTTYPVILDITFQKREGNFEVLTFQSLPPSYDVNKAVIDGNFIGRDDTLSLLKQELLKENAPTLEKIELTFNPHTANWIVRELTDADFLGAPVRNFTIDAVSKAVSQSVMYTM